MNIRDKKYGFIRFYDVKNVKIFEKEFDVIRIGTISYCMLICHRIEGMKLNGLEKIEKKL